MDAIVFDWDGTLMDSLVAVFDANAKILAEYGVPFDAERYRAAYTPDWRVMYQRLGVPEAALEAAGERWLELYSDADEAQLLPGAADALRRLADAGFVLGLVTAGDQVVVEAQMERLGVAGLLPIRVYGSDDVAAKPHPEPLLRALNQLERADRAHAARYVGDVPDDMRMACAVGALGIGIESSIGTRVELLKAGATAVYASVGEFVDDLLGTPKAAARQAAS
jgi:HAD superfamily hydrolase (TIGR01549 family)